MAEYVEKSIIFPALNKAMSENGALGMADVEDIIDDLPTADVQPVKRGRWINNGDCLICSCCKTAYNSWFTGSNYCSECGADMRGDENGTKT